MYIQICCYISIGCTYPNPNHAVSRRKFARAASRPCGHKGSNRNTDIGVSKHNQDLPLGRTADTLGPKSKQKPHDGTHATKKPIR